MTWVLRIFFLTLVFLTSTVVAQEKGSPLPTWQEGMLDIHHINTGRGDAAFCIFPDGTTLLIDAGDMSESHTRTLSARNAKAMPDSSKSPPEWIVDYIEMFNPEKKGAYLDYALITHYHDDHFGEIDSLRKKAKGGYLLTGIMEVGTLLPVKKLLDRGFDYPIDLKDLSVQVQKRFSEDPYGMVSTLKEYWKFIEYTSISHGLVNETLHAGRNDQIILNYGPEKFPNFEVRNIAVNGIIWTGENQDTFALFNKNEYGGENPLSACIKISYGDFDYFTGGDISGVDRFGAADMDSMESNIAPVVGRVDVATLNHHGNRDSQNAIYVRTIRPRVWVQQNWSSDHPGERDIFSTVLLKPNIDVLGDQADQYKSQNGHIVIRVHEDGNTYEVIILDDADVNRQIVAKYGPYVSR